VSKTKFFTAPAARARSADASSGKKTPCSSVNSADLGRCIFGGSTIDQYISEPSSVTMEEVYEIKKHANRRIRMEKKLRALSVPTLLMNPFHPTDQSNIAA
jgi:hypothetical protein